MKKTIDTYLFCFLNTNFFAEHCKAGCIGTIPTDIIKTKSFHLQRAYLPPRRYEW